MLAIAVFFSPLVDPESSRREQLNQAWKQLQQKTREVEPLRGLDKKIPVARKEIADFYAQRLPSQDSGFPPIWARSRPQTGVRIESVKYAMKDPETLGVRRVEIEADLAGDYLQLVRFINALERDQAVFPGG